MAQSASQRGLKQLNPAGQYVGRFAPSTTGPAHPGTLLAGLLAWLDARSQDGKFILRLEDLDPDRAQVEFTQNMIDDLTWFGLDWDELNIQSENRDNHEAALDKLANAGLLYPCSMSRAEIKKVGRRSPDGGFAYPNTNRGMPLPATGWRDCQEPLRAQLPDKTFHPREQTLNAWEQNPSAALGDPIVKRRDGAFSYNLAVVVDDAQSGITHVVRGSDIGSSTATQLALMELLGIEAPVYRHHFLLLEPRGDKLAKLHGSIGTPVLRQHYSSQELCGILAHLAGLQGRPQPCAPHELVENFSWNQVRKNDLVLEWDEAELKLVWNS